MEESGRDIINVPSLNSLQDWLRKNMINLRQNSKSPGSDLNPWPPDYETEVILTRQWRSIPSVININGPTNMKYSFTRRDKRSGIFVSLNENRSYQLCESINLLKLMTNNPDTKAIIFFTSWNWLACNREIPILIRNFASLTSCYSDELLLLLDTASLFISNNELCIAAG